MRVRARARVIFRRVSVQERTEETPAGVLDRRGLETPRNRPDRGYLHRYSPHGGQTARIKVDVAFR